MVWEIALNVWLLLVGLTWWGQITASNKFLGIFAVLVVVVYVLELLLNHMGIVRTRQPHP